MKAKFVISLILIFVLAFSPLSAYAAEEAAAPVPSEVCVSSAHSAMIGGAEVSYTAQVGSMIIPAGNDAGDRCEIFYTAYVADGQDRPSDRPITFAFNGGPGCASAYVHMGFLGPRRLETDENGMAIDFPPKLIDNPESILDITDLVFIDPVETGYSRPLEGSDIKAFFGYENDCRTVGDFICQYVSRNGRWSSPKYLIGESYGTSRAVGVCKYLADTHAMGLNGLILVSSANNYSALEFGNGNELPYATFLPTFAATAWYHKCLDDAYQNMGIEEFVSLVRSFVEEEYVPALFKGSALTAEEKDGIAQKIASFTGLDKEFVLKQNLRISDTAFYDELLKDRHLKVGRVDGRYTGPQVDGDINGAGDPSLAQIDNAFGTAINMYLKDELGYQTDRPYIMADEITEQMWTFMGENAYLNQEKILYEVMSNNAFLKVWVLCGYYDMATPFYAAEWVYHHLFLNEETEGQLQFSYYPSGHMIYMEDGSRASFREEAKAWFAD